MHVRLPGDSTSTVEFYTFRGPVSQGAQRLETGETTTVADPVARLTRECSALRIRLATAERRERHSRYGPYSTPTPISARSPISLDRAIEDAFARRDVVRTQIQIEVMKLAERYRTLEQTLREMQEALRQRDQEIEALRQERDRLIAERDQAHMERGHERVNSSSALTDNSENNLIHIQNGVEKPKGRHRSRSRSRAQMRKLEAIQPMPPTPRMSLDAEHIARARSMDVFLTKTDSWSGVQVIQAVEDLNSEINQFAASATESCVFARRLKTHSPQLGEDPGPGQQENAPWLGASFARVLAARDHNQDPILVQLALQASIATCCARSLTLFCVGFPSKLDALLSRVFMYMQSSGMCAVSLPG